MAIKNNCSTKFEKPIAIAVIIHHYSLKSETFASVQSINSNVYPDCKIIITGNEFFKLEEALKNDSFSNIILVETGGKASRAEAYNAGIKRALELGAEYLLLLSGGLTADDNLLDALLDAQLQAEDNAVLGALIFSRQRPWVILDGGIRWEPGKYTWEPLQYAGCYSAESIITMERVEYISSSAMFFSKQLFERVGYFDTRLSSCFADIDWCARAKHAGATCLVATKARVWVDDRQENSVTDNAEDVYLHTKSLLLWARKNLVGSQRLRFYLNHGWRIVTDEPLSVRFWVSHTGTVPLAKRLYWASTKYLKDVSVKTRGSVAYRAKIHGIRDFFLRRFDVSKDEPIHPKTSRLPSHAPRSSIITRCKQKKEFRILFLSHVFPYPLDCGVNIRVNNILRSLASVAKVDWIGYTEEEELPERDGMENLGELCPSVQVFCTPIRPKIAKRNYRKIFRHYMLASDPLIYSAYPAQLLVQKALQKAEVADLIWVERLKLAHWLKDYSHKMIVDVDDIDSVNLRRQAEIEPPSLLKWSRQIDLARLEKTERKAAEVYSRLVVCSERDKNFWPSHADRLWVIPNGVEDRLFDLPEVQKYPYQLIFVGTLDYQPNKDAIDYFCKEILPLINKKIPEVSLWIVGKNPSRSILDLHDGKRVHVIGYVSDVAEYVQQAAVSVVPLRAGGGTRLKIIESLALGTPVVSTTVGAEGLYLEPGKHLLTADTPIAFAEAVLRLLKDKQMRKQLAETGKERVQTMYKWSSIRQQLANLITDWANEQKQENEAVSCLSP